MLTAWRRYLGDPVASWRTGSPQSQALTLVVLLCGVALCFVVSVIEYSLMPMTTYFLWLLLGMLLLRFRPLAVLCGVTAAAAVGAILLDPPMTVPRVAACLTLGIAVALILFASSRQQSGLPGAMGEAMLADLRDRLHSQSAMPTLPEPWTSQSSLVAANSVGYGGDFMIAHLSDDQRRLEVILVDVCGKGVQAASQGAAVQRRPRRADRRALAGRTVQRGQPLPAAQQLRRDLRDRRARARRPADRLLRAHQRRAPTRPALVDPGGRLGRRPRSRHRAGHPRRPRAAHDQRHPAAPATR